MQRFTKNNKFYIHYMNVYKFLHVMLRKRFSDIRENSGNFISARYTFHGSKYVSHTFQSRLKILNIDYRLISAETL